MINLIEPALALAEGVALIVSPCILPVLPLVLSASIDGGRKRPFGIIIGFVLAFSIFALASRKIVNAFGIDLDIIKNASLVFLGLFGLVLLSSALSEKFSGLTQGFANAGNKYTTGNKPDGLLSGILIGAFIGLIWTPCAGPILAVVLVQVIRQETDLQSLFIIVPFAIGAGLPMLIISLTGRKIMNKLGFFTTHAEAIRKGFGIIILLAVAFIASGSDAQSLFASKEMPAAVRPMAAGLEDGLEKPYPAPDFADIQQWLNSDPLTMAQLKGKVVLIDFWTYSCINCVRTLPYITSWDQKYRDKGLVIIGVHAPEFEFEKNTSNVKAALVKHGIKYPVAQDNNLSTWTNFQNRYWPAHYLIDKNGQVVYTHFGEGHYDKTEHNIRYLLGLDDQANNTMPPSPSFLQDQTAETYLGYGRGERYSGTPEWLKDTVARYNLPKFLPLDHWALSGGWKVGSENITATDKSATLQLNFKARKLFLVLGSTTGKPVRAVIHLNGEKVNTSNAGDDVKDHQVTITGHTLYELIDQKTAKNSLFAIEALDPGLEAYAFTFGN
jgi:cytochrome c biogenesis protein CcdA/thiol-disulfide isomerase/thioredoxin